MTRAAPLLLLAAAALAAASPAAAAPEDPVAEVVLLRGGTVLTMAGEPVQGGSVLLRGGRIEAVGRDLEAPAGARIVDCAGLTVLPGFIDAGTRVGLVDIDLVEAANDSDEGGEPSTPDLDVRDGINIESPVFAVTRSHGVTTVLVYPQETNVICGRGAVLHCIGPGSGALEERVVRAPSGLHVSFGGPPKERFGGKDRMPSTRMGVAAVLRQELEKAREHVRKRTAHAEKARVAAAEGKSPPDPPAPDLALDVLAAALGRELPVFARAERLDDIRTAVRIADEYGLRLVLLRATEAWKMAAELAEKRIPVIHGPVLRQPDSPEAPGARMDAPALLHAAGVRFCLMTGDAHNARNLPYHAGIAVSHGLPREAALGAITREAASILGVDRDLGTIEAGKEATLVVFRGDPLEPLSVLEHVFVRGRELPRTSRQTELRDRWK